jgi:hypothetical protein
MEYASVKTTALMKRADLKAPIEENRDLSTPLAFDQQSARRVRMHIDSHRAKCVHIPTEYDSFGRWEGTCCCYSPGSSVLRLKAQRSRHRECRRRAEAQRRCKALVETNRHERRFRLPVLALGQRTSAK